MSGRFLWPWEELECKALKLALIQHNRKLPTSGRVTQRAIADALGVSIPTVRSILRGQKSINLNTAVGFQQLTGIPIETFSERLAHEARRTERKKINLEIES